jgi:hypothetical protein
MALPNQPIANTTPLAQPLAEVRNSNTVNRTLKEQRAWPFQSSYLVMEDLEEYLDGLPDLCYSLDVRKFLDDIALPIL